MATHRSFGRTMRMRRLFRHVPGRLLVVPLDHSVGDATALKSVAGGTTPDLELVELTVTATAHVGMGERACVDLCLLPREDEGMLVGSHSMGMILCVSETHPLPYMPTLAR